MHELGLAGMPRRTMIGGARYVLDSWKLMLPMTMIGGLIMFASAALYYLNMIMTISAGQKDSSTQEVTFAKAVSGPEDVPMILDRFTPWLLVAAVLILVNYGPTLFNLVTNARLNIPGLSPW